MPDLIWFPATYDYWELFADKEVKGRNLTWHTLEGIAVKPKIMADKIGQDGHDRGANVIASAFADMSFDVVSGPLFKPPTATRDMALAEGVDTIGASSLAAGHKTLVPELINLLRKAGSGDMKVAVGGVIPPHDYDFLREAGVPGIYGPGSNVVECGAEMLRLPGHNMPPAGDELH